MAHIRLIEANPGKLSALDQLVSVYLTLCQQYVTLFCTEADPDKYAAPVFETALSDRWHRVAMQQAAGIAKSWRRTNRAKAYEAYLEAVSDWKLVQEVEATPKRREPEWHEWNIPELRIPCIQANVNVVVVEPSKDSRLQLLVAHFDAGQGASSPRPRQTRFLSPQSPGRPHSQYLDDTAQAERHVVADPLV